MTVLPKRVLLLVGIALLVVVAGVFGFKYYTAERQIQALKSGTQTSNSQTEEASLIAQVGKLIDLPTDETPTIATVTDISKLKDQPFFSKAKNGDKVLIYQNAKKAIIFDPLEGKIVDVAPVNLGSSSAQLEAAAKIVILNGTTSVGLTKKVETKIKKVYPNADIVDKDNAQKSNYSVTIVVPLNDNAQAVAKSLSTALSASMSALPAGESAPKNIDILVIAGKDQI